jgi:hypothetical protein
MSYEATQSRVGAELFLDMRDQAYLFEALIGEARMTDLKPFFF